MKPETLQIMAKQNDWIQRVGGIRFREHFAIKPEGVDGSEVIRKELLGKFMTHLEREVNYFVSLPETSADEGHVDNYVSELRKTRGDFITKIISNYSGDTITYDQCREILELVEGLPTSVERSITEHPIFEALDRQDEWVAEQARARLPIIFGIDPVLDEESRPVGTVEAIRIPNLIDLVSKQEWTELTESNLSGITAKGGDQFRAVMEAKQKKVTDSLTGIERVTYEQAVRIIREVRDATEEVLSGIGADIDPVLASHLKGREARMCADVVRLLGGHEGYEPEEADQSERKESASSINKQRLFDLLVEVEGQVNGSAEGQRIQNALNDLPLRDKQALVDGKAAASKRKGQQMEQLKEWVTEGDCREFMSGTDSWAFDYTSVRCKAPKKLLEDAKALGDGVVAIVLKRLPELLSEAGGEAESAEQLSTVSAESSETPTGPTITNAQFISIVSNYSSIAQYECSERENMGYLSSEASAEYERLSPIRVPLWSKLLESSSDELTLADCRAVLARSRSEIPSHVAMSKVDHPLFAVLDAEEEWARKQVEEFLAGKMDGQRAGKRIDVRSPMFPNTESSNTFCLAIGCKSLQEHLDGLKEVFVAELGEQGEFYHQEFLKNVYEQSSGVRSVIKSWTEIDAYSEIFLARVESFCLADPEGNNLRRILLDGYRQAFDRSSEIIGEMYSPENTPCVHATTHFMVGDKEVMLTPDAGKAICPEHPGIPNSLKRRIEAEIDDDQASARIFVEAALKANEDTTKVFDRLTNSDGLDYCGFLLVLSDLDRIQSEFAYSMVFVSQATREMCGSINDSVMDNLYINGRMWFETQQAAMREGGEIKFVSRERVLEVIIAANKRADEIIRDEKSAPTPIQDYGFESIIKDAVLRLCPAQSHHPAHLRAIGYWLIGRIEGIGAIRPNDKDQDVADRVKEVNEQELDKAYRGLCEDLLLTDRGKAELAKMEYALQIVPSSEVAAMREQDADCRAVDPKKLCKELCDCLWTCIDTGKQPKPKGVRKGKASKRNKQNRNAPNGANGTNGIPVKVARPYIRKLQQQLTTFMDSWMPYQIQTHAPLNAIVSFTQECNCQFGSWLREAGVYSDDVDQEVRDKFGTAMDTVIGRYSEYLLGKDAGSNLAAATKSVKPSDTADGRPPKPQKTYPVPALIHPTRNLEDAWREIDERNAMNRQQRELHMTNQVRGFAVNIWENFRGQCAQLENFNVRDETERDQVTGNAIRCVRALEDAMVGAVRQECATHDLNESISLRPVEEAALGVNTTDFSLPPEIAKCFGEAIISGYGSGTEEAQAINTEPLPILIASQKELIDRGVNELKAGMSCTFLRNMFAGVEAKPVKLPDRECCAVRGRDFSADWVRQVNLSVGRSVDSFVSMRQPRQGATPEDYVKGLFDSRIQHAIFQRARGLVEDSLRKLKHGPSDSVIGDLTRVLPDLTQGEREASITSSELQGFVRVELLGDRKPEDNLFQQEIPAIEQFCRNRNLDPNRDIEEQLREDMAGLNQLAERFDHEFHADLNFRRAGGGEQLLKLAVHIGARMMLARKTADKASERRLREQAMDALLKIPNLRDLAVMVEENAQWMKEWPVKHSKPDDQLGYWELRFAHEESDAYLQRCRIQGGEASGYAVARAYAEDVKEARERGVIVIEGLEPAEKADDAQTETKKRRTRRSLSQDTKKVKQYVARKAGRRGQLAHGEATADSGSDMSPELGELVAGLRKDDAERAQLEALLRSLPDHTKAIDQLVAVIEDAQGQKKQADELLAELNSGSSGEVITRDGLVQEASSIMARAEGLRVRVTSERTTVSERREEAEHERIQASQRLDDLSLQGIADPASAGVARRIMQNREAERIELDTRLSELARLLEQIDYCDLAAAECLEGLASDIPSEPIDSDGELDESIGALEQEAEACHSRFVQFKKLETAATEKDKLGQDSARLETEITAKKAELRGLRNEQKRRDDAQAQLNDIKAKLAAVMNAYSPESDA